MPTKFCRHIRVNGERCGARALVNQIFCYFHVELERRHRCLNRRNKLSSELSTILHPMSFQDGAQRDPIFAEPTGPPFQLDLPPLEDRHSIQVALSLVITALAEGRIDPKRAAMLFYGLQVASSNAHKLNPIPKRALGKVSKTILDESNGNLIAPDEEPEDPEETEDFERPGFATRYWLQLEAEQNEKRRLAAEKEADSTPAAAYPVPYGPGDTE
jgi:hypothetical protein